MNETQTSPAPAQRSDGLAQNVALLLVFILPILFLPTSWVPFEYAKVVLVLLAALVPLGMWGYSRFKEGSIMYPNSYVLLATLLLPFAYLLSALLSGDISKSVVGYGFENSTVVFVLLLAALTLGTSLLFTSIASIARMLLVIGTSFGVLATLQVVRIFVGAEHILPSIFSSNVTATVLGSWSDLAVLSGLMTLVGIVALMYAPRTKLLRACTYATLALSLVLLIVVNIQVVWIVLAVLSLILTVHTITAQSSTTDMTEQSNNAKRWFTGKVAAPLAVFIVSVLFSFVGNTIGNTISDKLHIQYVDVRPSWGGTVEVVGASWGDGSMLFGTGPNTFNNSWTAHKPTGVNDTVFWNIDFVSGIGTVPTAFATVGIVGGLLWLALLASILYLAFRALWARMPNDITRFVVLSTIAGVVYIFTLLVVYVPQTVMLAIAFVLLGLFVAAARNVNVVKTRKIYFKESAIYNFVSTLLLSTVALVSILVVAIAVQRVVVTSLLQRSVIAAQEQDLSKAQSLADKAKALSLGGVLGGSENAYTITTQIAILRLGEVAQSDQTADDYPARLQQAIADVIVPAKAVVDADADNYSQYVFIGEIYEQLANFGIEGSYEAAVDAYTKAAELNPTNPSIPLMNARLAFAAGNDEEAKAYTQQSLALKSNYADAHYLLSQIAIKNNEIDEAISSSEAAVVLAPNNAGLLFQLGVLQYTNGDYSKAQNVLERAININPQYANALYYLGMTYAQQGSTESALTAFKRVAELNPDNEEIQSVIKNLESQDTGDTPDAQMQEQSTQ